jgi:hypothetical protein
VENLIAHVDELKGKLKENVATHAEQARCRENSPRSSSMHPCPSISTPSGSGRAMTRRCAACSSSSNSTRSANVSSATASQAGRGHAVETSDTGEFVAKLKTIADVAKRYRRITADDTAGVAS